MARNSRPPLSYHLHVLFRCPANTSIGNFNLDPVPVGLVELDLRSFMQPEQLLTVGIWRGHDGCRGRHHDSGIAPGAAVLLVEGENIGQNHEEKDDQSGIEGCFPDPDSSDKEEGGDAGKKGDKEDNGKGCPPVGIEQVFKIVDPACQKKVSAVSILSSIRVRANLRLCRISLSPGSRSRARS